MRLRAWARFGGGGFENGKDDRIGDWSCAGPCVGGRCSRAGQPDRHNPRRRGRLAGALVTRRHCHGRIAVPAGDTHRRHRHQRQLRAAAASAWGLLGRVRASRFRRRGGDRDRPARRRGRRQRGHGTRRRDRGGPGGWRRPGGDPDDGDRLEPGERRSECPADGPDAVRHRRDSARPEHQHAERRAAGDQRLVRLRQRLPDGRRRHERQSVRHLERALRRRRNRGDAGAHLWDLRRVRAVLGGRHQRYYQERRKCVLGQLAHELRQADLGRAQPVRGGVRGGARGRSEPVRTRRRSADRSPATASGSSTRSAAHGPPTATASRRPASRTAQRTTTTGTRSS